MKRELHRWCGIAFIVLGTLLGVSAISSLAQEKQAAGERVIIERDRVMQGPPDMPLPPLPPGGDFLFLATEMSFGGKVVKGSPYSAVAVTESTQTLSDGNRIVNKSNAAVYRDSEGRTRREQTLRAIGPLAKGGEPRQIIFITDPVAGINYHLDPQEHVAYKMPPMNFKFEKRVPPPPPEGAAGVPRVDVPRVDHEEFTIQIQPDVLIQKKGTEAGVSVGWIGPQNRNAQTESLGKQNIEGVEAEGTRTTVTIPAGEIGNEKAIEIVSERWYSAELQTVVMSRHSDPRFGENTYRLTNISRTEPARSLFEVPADYTFKEGPMHKPETIRTRKPASNQE
jgi:hypothetical protein